MTKPKITKREIPMDNSSLLISLNKCLKEFEQDWDLYEEDGKTEKKTQTMKIKDWLKVSFNNEKEIICLEYKETKMPKDILKKFNIEFRSIEEKISHEEFKKIPFYSKNSDVSYTSEFTDENYGLLSRKSILLEIAKRFENVGIKRMLINTDEYSKKICSQPTICFDTNSSGSLRWEDISDMYPKEYDILYSKHKYITEKIKGKEYNIGIYLPDRNIVVLFLWMFGDNGNHYFKNYDWDDNKEFVKLFDKIIEKLKPLKIKKKPTRKEHELVTIQTFVAGAESKKNSLISDIKQYQSAINDAENSIMDYYAKIKTYSDELKFISNSSKNMAKTLSDEINKIRKLAIVNKVSLKEGAIEVEYIPTCIKVPDYQPSAATNGFGKREIYIGRMVARLTPDSLAWTNLDKFKIEGNEGYYIHPHVNGEFGNACYGKGEASKLITEYRGNGKYLELIRYLWMWIQTCKDGSGYNHSEIFYNENMRRGFPVWDEKGEKIVANDPARLKTKEQIKIKKFSKDRNKNLKLFKDLKKPI